MGLELREYYINDDVYSFINCILNDHATVTVTPLACTFKCVNPTRRGVMTYSFEVSSPSRLILSENLTHKIIS